MPVRLPLVSPDSELTRPVPPVLERAAKRCSRGDATHRGLVFLALHFADLAIKSAVAPSARAPAAAALVSAEGWARGNHAAKDVEAVRAQTYGAMSIMAQKTWTALEPSLNPSLPTESAFDHHANNVVRRYITLSAVHAIGACLLTLDGVPNPLNLVDVPGQVAGSLALQRVALGAARSARLRRQAEETAHWEHALGLGHAEHPAEALAVQLFHEYLGSSFNEIKSATQVHFDEFVIWALSFANAGSHVKQGQSH